MHSYTTVCEVAQGLPMFFLASVEQYNVQVTVLNQPLLISKGKWKKSQQDTPHEPIFLVPELCHLTGTVDLCCLRSQPPLFKVTDVTR